MSDGLEWEAGQLEAAKQELEAANEELRCSSDELQCEIEQRRQAEADLQRLNRTLKALSHSNKAMMRATDESQYLDDVCRIIVGDCGHALVWIGYAEHDEGKTVRPVAYSGFEEGYLETLDITWADTERGRGPTGTAIRTGLPSACRNMLTDPRFEPWREQAISRGYASSAVFPLLSDGKAFGAITIYSREPESFSDDEMGLLGELADDLAYGISAIRLRAAHRQASQDLRESERRVRLKLDSILTPEGDIGSLDLADILDSQAIQSAMDSFYALAHIPMAIIDIEGKVLVGAGWQDICTKFHRVHPETCRHCTESDTLLTQGVQPGAFKLYKCKNNMWDVSTPIMVGGHHVGNLFSGQFFFDDEPLDYDLFRSQAHRYGFDEQAYITALERAPRMSRESLHEGMSFFIKLADMISKLSYSNIKLARSVAERDTLMSSLRESEEKATALLNATTETVWLIDANGCILGANTTAAEKLGMSVAEVVGKRSYDLLPPHVAEVRRAHCESVIRGGEPVRFEDERDGIIFDHSYYPVRDASGRATGVAIFSHDITERKQAENALRKAHHELDARAEELEAMNEELVSSNEELHQEVQQRIEAQKELQRQRHVLSAVASNTDVHLVYLDRDFNFVWVNPAYARACDRPQEEFVGHNHFEFYPHEENQAIFERVRDTGEPFEIKEKPFVFPDHPEWGVSYWDWTLTPIKDSDGAVSSMVFSLMNATHDVVARQEIERLRAEAESRASELESLLASVVDGVTLVDAQGRLLLMNEAGRRILGVPADADISSLTGSSEMLGLDGTPMRTEDSAVHRALRGETVSGMRYFVKVSPGQAVPIAIASAPVVGPEARIVGATTVFRDISEQLEFERNRDILYQREHHIADVLQRALIQDTEYEIPGLDIAVRYEPALSEAEVGGDFYDIFDVGDNKVGILVGDVAGKGLAAAVRVAAVRHAIRSYAFIDPRPGRVMSLANNALCRDRSDEAQMVTAIFAVVDTAVGTITYSSGGHEPVQLRRADGTVEGTDIGGRVLGVLEDYDYPESSVRLQVDDTVLIFTDGITEARPDATHLFGAKGVSAYLSEHGHRSTEDIAAGLLDAAKAHSQGGLRDDVAIVCIRLKGLGQLRAGR